MSASAALMCRVCLNTDKYNYISLFEKYKDSSINDYVLLITNVVIKEHDGFSDRICSTCFFDLETALHFKQKCESSDRILKNQHSILDLCQQNTDNNTITLKKEEEPLETEVGFDSNDHYINDNNTDFGTLGASENEELEVFKPRRTRAIDLKLECHDCGGLFKSKFKLSIHWKQVHMFNGLICNICKRMFKSYKAYHFHKNNKPKNCIIAGNKLVRVEGEGSSRMFHCKECTYNTKRITDIRQHIAIHNGERPFICHICTNTFTQRTGLYSHMEAVHKEYKVEITCPDCGLHIRGRAAMYRHLRTHSKPKLLSKSESHIEKPGGVKPYMCEECAKSFNTLVELCTHRKLAHIKYRYTFDCNLCGYTTSRRDIILKHKNRHMDTNFACIVCGKFFDTLEKGQAHQRRHFNENKFPCPHCDMKFLRQDSVPRHIRTVHGSITVRSKEQNKPIVAIKHENLNLMDDMIEISPTTVG